MSPWWHKSSPKEAKKTGNNKANLGGIFGLIRKRIKKLSESMQKSSQRRDEIVSEAGYNFQPFSRSTPVTQFQNVDERPQSYPLPLPVNESDTDRLELGKQASRSIERSKDSSEFAFSIPKSNHAGNGHDRNNVEGNLVTDSAFTDSGVECDDPSGFRLTSPQECNYQTSTCSPSSHVNTTQKKREKQKQVKACVNTQTIATSPKQLPNLQIPQFGGFCSAPDSSKSSASKSPMRVVGSEPGQNDFWAMRPSADPVFLGPGPSSSPVSGHMSQLPWQNRRCAPERVSPIPSPRMTSPGPSPRKQSGPPSSDPGFLGPGPSSSPESGYNLSQLSWQNCRRTPERGSPIPSPRMTSPVPSQRIQSGPSSADPGFIVPGPSSSSGSGYNTIQVFRPNSRCTPESGSPVPSPRMTSPGPSPRRQTGPPSANWPDDAVNGKQQAHRLPLPPRALSNTGPYSPRTTLSVTRSPGRADLVASTGSRWKKGHLLGRGEYGHVYLGFDSENGEMCAMKEVTLSVDDERLKESVQQLGQEIALLSILRHSNIVQFYGFETVHDKLYIYLEYVGGGSIYKILQEHGALGECIIRNYTRQILEGLSYLHAKNMVHSDLKGANILVDGKGCIKLADFGVARHISGPSCALSLKGSANWMAPELVNNTRKGCGYQVDIWSLGCTIQEMATTKPPWSDYEGAAVSFKILNSKEIKPPDELSDEGKDFMLQCMQRDPSHRPSAAQLLQHPFVRNIPEDHNISFPVPHMGSPLLHQ